MNFTRTAIAVAAMMSFAACTVEQVNDPLPEESPIETIDATVKAVEGAEKIETKTTFSYSDGAFTWEDNDIISFWPSSADVISGDTPSCVKFTVAEGGSSNATFVGSGWALKRGATYYASVPYRSGDTYNNVVLNYAGQTQVANNNDSHLSHYDYLHAFFETPATGNASIEFVRISTIAKFELTIPASLSSMKFTSLKLVSSEAIFPNTVYYDPSQSSVTLKKTSNSTSFVIGLNGNNGIQAQNGILTVYAMMPQIAWAGKPITVTLTGTDSEEYSGTLTPKSNQSANTKMKYTSSIIPPVINVTSVSLSKTELNLTCGETSDLVATITPSNATDQNVVWSSSDDKVATVSNGTVTAVSGGSATITVKTVDGNKTATCNVIVTQPTTGVSLDKTKLDLTVGSTSTLTATVNPSNASNQNVTWKSSNTAVATVSTTGVVTAKGTGTATITVTTEDGGKTATCSVTVTQPVTGISLAPSTLNLNVGTTSTLTATVSPSNASNKDVTWSSSNTSVATVSGGTVTAVAPGTATITVKTNDGSKTATCSVTVTQPVTSVTLNKTSMTLNVGATSTLTATVNPSNASNKSVTWSSSNASVATVSNGTVTAIAPGTATITVKTNDGSKTATCSVTVKQPVTSVTLNKTSMTLNVGATSTLTATISPSNATNPNVTWSSSNTSIATVSGGTVTAVAPGTATITVKTNDGGKTATCSVTVIQPVASVALNKMSMTLTVGSTSTLTATISPSNASNKNKTWSSSNTSIATVSGGTVTAVAPGTATITVTTVDGSKTATCLVTVTKPVTGITLNSTNINLVIGSTSLLVATVSPDDAGNKTVYWGSMDRTVATVQDGLVTAVGTGTTTIIAETEEGKFKAQCSVTVTDIQIQTTGMVDMGLSVKWAAMNVGATAPEQYGNYFAWGEGDVFSTKSSFNWSNYAWANGTDQSFKLTKYNNDSSKGTVDNRTSLVSSDDIAHNIDGDYLIPTSTQVNELINNCTWTWTKYKKVQGFLVKSNINGNKLFIPAAGYYYSSTNDMLGFFMCFWTRDLYTSNSERAVYYTSYNGAAPMPDNINRCYGVPIRAVEFKQ